MSESPAPGVIGLKCLQGALTLKGGNAVRFEREIMLAAGLPYVYVTTRVVYPRTPDHGYDRGKAHRLQQAWDNAWQEFSLLLAPYAGDAPPETARYDAEAFAYPYLVLNDEQVIAALPHRSWDGASLGV